MQDMHHRDFLKFIIQNRKTYQKRKHYFINFICKKIIVILEQKIEKYILWPYYQYCN